MMRCRDLRTRAAHEDRSMTEAEPTPSTPRRCSKKKAARDKIIATKTIEKGLLIVHTGKGKGKSTAAFGMVFRALGHGMRSASCSSSRARGRPASARRSSTSPTS